MTAEGEVELLQMHLQAAEKLVQSLHLSMSRVARLMPVDAHRLASLSPDEHIGVLAFLKTFEQLEETLGRTLKVIVLLMAFGKVERLTPRDIANRALSLGIIADGRAWADAVRTRNELAHEYPLNPKKQSEQINKAWTTSDTLFVVRSEIVEFVRRERLTDALL